jgi:RimJ/RimL family protein N-acetyltransferase
MYADAMDGLLMGYTATRALILAVVKADTDELLGACDLRIHDVGCAEIAYMLGARARGCGVMTRAVQLISLWAIEQLGIRSLEILATRKTSRRSR